MVWPSTRVAGLLGVRYPIVQAPMAGGPTTPELVAAVSNAGGLGSIAGAYVSPDALREQIRAVRALTERPFAVNLFAPLEPREARPEAVAALQRALAPYRSELGLPEAEPALPRLPPDAFDAQLAVVAEERAPVFSFTFGIPNFEPARDAGALIVGTATTVAEAAALEERGVDIVVAQGSEAGGHRGTFLGPFDRGLVGGIALVPRIVDRVGIPVLAAGGIIDGRGVAAALALGAEGVQLGTAFLACRESGAHELHKRALAAAADGATAVTDVFTGRPARALRTPFMEELERARLEILPFPLQGMLAGDVRTAAAAQGRADLMFMLAGQAAPLSRDGGAGDLVEALARETAAVLAPPGAFNHVHLRVGDLSASTSFYEIVLAPLGIAKTWDDGALVELVGLALSADGPVSRNVHMAFTAETRGAVDAFHGAGITAGYRDNGAPGFRDYARDYYAAYLLDPDGNNVEAVHRGGPPQR